MLPTLKNSHHAFRRQNLLIEFASLKYASPQGIYMSLSPQEPRLWWGVIFVRKGPYAPAILKFTVLFPMGYPIHPPIITFLSDIYHPLIVPPSAPPPPPPTTSSSSTSSPGKQHQHSAAHYNYNQNVSNLPPGSFSLAHGFPSWTQAPSPRTTSSPGSKKLPPNPPLTPLDSSATKSSLPVTTSSPEKDKNILEVLHYLKSVFSSQTVLDEIPPHLAVNLGAWRAWRSYRESGKESGNPDGARVWLEKVNSCISGSQSEGVLYGGLGVGRGGGGLGGEEMIRFLDIDEDEYERIKQMIVEREGTSVHYPTGLTI